ncbi:MAG TPA: TrmH family RNA methyltransferase [Candidatus Saccharimonadales bacterium]|nr:TrmH family RNA methyltransferase [Candidatus Saccharimonadales bacterium]
MRQIILIAHNLRSAHNVGSLLRTAEGLGAEQIYLTGYTPYPRGNGDTRLPHLAAKIDKQIAKTALGAEKTVSWRYDEKIEPLMGELQKKGFTVAALEQAADSVKLPGYKAPEKIVFIVGREVEGIEPAILALCDEIIEIPMSGQKESFNVVQAAAMALYQFRFGA